MRGSAAECGPFLCFTSHRPPNHSPPPADYDEALLLVEVADTLWSADSRFVMLGHGSGSAIAATAAGAFPHRASALVVCESVLGLAGTGWANAGKHTSTLPSPVMFRQFMTECV